MCSISFCNADFQFFGKSGRVAQASISRSNHKEDSMVASPKNLLPNVFYAAKVEYYAARKACPKRNRALPYHVVDRTTPLKA
jgi:hypothetical protein